MIIAEKNPAELSERDFKKYVEVIAPRGKRTAPDLQLVPKEVADQLDKHAKNIHSFIKGEEKGAGELCGYAVLIGLEFLKAKEIVPHGNKDANGGLMNWAEARFPELPYRSATRKMQLAELVVEKLATVANLKKTPLLLGKKLTPKDRAFILKIVPEIMDGKGMLQFMRDARLLRDAEQPTHHPRKAVNADAKMAAQKKQAVRHWETISSDLELGAKVLKHMDDADLAKALDATITAGNAIREYQKLRKGKQS